MRPSFTLLHGTWARHAAWTHPESKLCGALRKRFGEQTEIHSVDWCGWNNVGTRTKGAEKLCKHLRALELAPDDRHFLIAHSHGGNVALYALTEPDVAKRVAGVATIATPYLIASKRQWSDRLYWALSTLGAAVFLVLAPYLDRLADRFGSGWLAGTLFLALCALLILGLYLVARAWDAYADRVVDAMSFGPISRERLLILRSPGDEASIALLTAKCFLAFGTVIVTFLAHLSSALSRLLLRMRTQPVFGWSIGIAILAAWLYLSVEGLIALQANTSWVWLFVSLLAILFLFLIIPIMTSAFEPDLNAAFITWNWLLAVAMLLSMIVPSTLMFFYGWQLAVANVAVDVSAEATPNGDWRVIMMKSKLPLGDDAAMALTHSALYEDNDALEAICTWVESVLALDASRGDVSNPVVLSGSADDSLNA
jgi:MFS family permease